MKFLVLVCVLVTFLALPVFAGWELPSNGSEVVINVPSPGLYFVQVGGTFRWGDGPPERFADPEWMFWESWEESWFEAGFGPAYDLGDVTIDGYFQDWQGLQNDGSYGEHMYSESHTYRVVKFIQSSFTARLFDTDYHDNLGSLSIEITPVPEPSSLVALASLGLLSLTARRKRR